MNKEFEKQEERLQLMIAKVGMPPRYPYINKIKEKHPELSEERANELRQTWNGRRYHKKNFKQSLI
jgi:uncharacterized short protein YbdD (DUF466 family)